MSIDPAKAKREAEIRAKLPDDVVALIDAAKLDPGAPFEPDARALLTKLRADDAPTMRRRCADVEPSAGDVEGDRRGDDRRPGPHDGAGRWRERR